jgi:hypothetical protein
LRRRIPPVSQVRHLEVLAHIVGERARRQGLDIMLDDMIAGAQAATVL